jgi:hypothetical protein
MDLCPEILEEVTMKLESVEDVMALGSCSRRLARIVGQTSLWRVIFSKTDLVEDGRVMEDRIRTITAFLTSLEDSDAIFFLLHQTIFDRFLATEEEEENITVSCPTSTQLHSVSGLGLELLALTDREGARHTVHKIKMSSIFPSLLLSLASLKRHKITEMVVKGVRCTTEEEGSALVSLLESSTTWRVGRLHLLGEVGQLTWEGLARVVARGTLEVVMATRGVMRRGRREDIRDVWQNTGLVWWVVSVGGGVICKRDGEEEGWGIIENIIQ